MKTLAESGAGGAFFVETKMITDYRPMIFSQLAARTEHYARRRRWLSRELLAVLVYGAVGLGLSCDTGFAPWQWQFWLMFAPLFAAGELAWRRITC